MTASTMHSRPRYEIESFRIHRADNDVPPELFWEGRSDVTVGEASGRADAIIAVRLNIDDGMYDGVYGDLGGHDEVQAIDRAIAALWAIRGGLADLIGETDGACLSRDDEGNPCLTRGVHGDHSFMHLSAD